MPETVQNLVDAVVQEASFDVSAATALVWINRRWRAMVGRARAYRKTVAIGSTVNGTAFYPVTGVIELYSLEVGGVPYGRARRPDGYANSQGRLMWDLQGEVGLFYADASTAAVLGVTLIPTPTSVLAITGLAAVEPPDLTVDAAGNTLLTTILDGEFYEPLIAGVTAIGYRRQGDVAQARDNEAMFDSGTDEFRRLAKRRFRGPGPTEIRVAGVNG